MDAVEDPPNERVGVGGCEGGREREAAMGRCQDSSAAMCVYQCVSPPPDPNSILRVHPRVQTVHHMSCCPFYPLQLQQLQQLLPPTVLLFYGSNLRVVVIHLGDARVALPAVVRAVGLVEPALPAVPATAVEPPLGAKSVGAHDLVGGGRGGRGRSQCGVGELVCVWGVWRSAVGMSKDARARVCVCVCRREAGGGGWWLRTE